MSGRSASDSMATARSMDSALCPDLASRIVICWSVVSGRPDRKQSNLTCDGRPRQAAPWEGLVVVGIEANTRAGHLELRPTGLHRASFDLLCVMPRLHVIFCPISKYTRCFSSSRVLCSFPAPNMHERCGDRNTSAALLTYGIRATIQLRGFERRSRSPAFSPAASSSRHDHVGSMLHTIVSYMLPSCTTHSRSTTNLCALTKSLTTVMCASLPFGIFLQRLRAGSPGQPMLTLLRSPISIMHVSIKEFPRKDPS